MANTDRVLLAESDDKLTIVIETALKKAGYEVVTFNDPDKLIAEMSAESVDFCAIIIDMPNASVPTLALSSSIAEILEDVPQILIVSSSDDEERAKSLLPVKKVLKKPFGVKDLVSAVHVIAGREVEEKNVVVRGGSTTAREKTSYSKKILVVDDAMIILKSAKLILERAGFNVITAEDGKKALLKVVSENPDLVITDIMMPGKDGFELLKDIKNNPKTKDIPVIMLTAKGYKEDILKAVSLNASDYIVKPFSPKLLVDRVKKVLKLD